MYLGAPLAFFLGGSSLSTGAPWIVNFVPAIETHQVKMLKPVRFSIRDGGTFIDPTTIRVVAGYARVYSNADQYFDKQLPSTKRIHFINERGMEPTLSIDDDGVFIQQRGDIEERTLYRTAIDSGLGYKSVMLTAILKPGADNAISGSGGSGPLGPSVFPGPLLPLPFSSGVGGAGSWGSGVLLGIENGPRNKVVYLWLQNNGSKILRLTSYLPEDPEEEPDINMTYSLNWTEFRRYTILWNEAEGYVEVYVDGASKDTRAFRVPISSIPDMPDDYYAKNGAAGQMTALYGLMAVEALDSVTISNVAFTTDVGYPVLGNVRPGDFVTRVIGAELIQTNGTIDPREDTVSAWMDAPNDLFQNRDDEASGASTAGIFAMTKPTVEKTFAIYREDPGLLSSNDDGFMIEARLHVSNTTQEGAATGTGITIFDGQNVFQLQLFQDPGFNTLGLLKKNGTDFDITEYFLPEDPIDWDGGHAFRLVVDPRQELILLYDCDDLNTPRMEVPFDRALLPSAEDKGWLATTPFIAIGHTMETTTAGTFSLYNLKFNHLYQAWETATDGGVPTAADPVFTEETDGTTSAAINSDGDFEITASQGATHEFSRTIEFGDRRGGIVEARVKISSWRPFTRTGTYVLLDDGLRTYALTFVESSTGKYAALSQRSGLGTFQELVGRDGDASRLSFLVDWTEFHTYRLERHPYDGVKVYLDNEDTPRIVFADSKLAQLPDVQYSGTPTLAFGQFTTEGATSQWQFVRGLFSRGYDISFKKNKPDAVLRTELYKTQALIIAHAQDEDA